MIQIIKRNLMLIIVFLFYSCSENAEKIERKPYPEELTAKLNRGLVSFIKDDKSNFISWRKLPSDSEDQDYFIWRKENNNAFAKVEKIAQTTSTNYVDENLNTNIYGYGISTEKQILPDSFERASNAKINGLSAIKFEIGEEYKQVHVVTGDLTGDGELEIIVNYSKMKAVDPFDKAWMKSTDSFRLAAFKKDGTKLWEFDRGLGIEAGRNFAPVVVWDLDADGKSEIILKTNKSEDPKNYEQEYIAILNGIDGKLLREARWPDAASDNFNSNSRNYIAIAHLDGINPSIIVARGLYHTQVVCSFDKNLNKEWERIIGKDIKPKFENKYLRKIWKLFYNDESRGSHSLPIADINEDGTEEILWGEHVIGKDGVDLWAVEERIPYSGHLDIVYSADMIDSLPGKEIFYCREGWGDKSDNIGMLLVDAKGETIWSKWGYTHVDGGWAAKVIPGNSGWQYFGYDVPKKVWTPGVHTFVNPAQHFLSSTGDLISNPDSSWIGSFTLDWEGDNIKELCTIEGQVKRYNGEIVLNLNKGILWSGDIWGDHREEIVYAPNDGNVYIIHNTEKMTLKPKITRLADRQYKNDLSRTAMQFNVIPTESGYIPIK